MDKKIDWNLLCPILIMDFHTFINSVPFYSGNYSWGMHQVGWKIILHIQWKGWMEGYN